MEKLTKEEFQEMYGNMVIDMADDGIDEIIDEVERLERLGDSSTAEASMYMLLGIVLFKLLDEEDRRTIQEVFLSLA